MPTPLETLRAQKSQATSTTKKLTPLEVYRQTHPVEPTLTSKVGGVAKAVAKDIYETSATIPVRATQAVAAAAGDVSMDKDFKKKAFEYASQPVDIGFGTQVKPLNTSSITAAGKQTAGDILKTASLTNIGGKLTFAKQAALQSGAYAGGAALQENKTPLQILRETAVGGAAGLVGGKVLSKVFGKGTKVDGEVISAEVPKDIPVPVVSSVVPEVTPTPKVEATTITPVRYAKDPSKALSDVTINPETGTSIADPVFQSSTDDIQKLGYEAVASQNTVDDLIDMSMGLKPVPEGLSPVTIHTLTSARKDLTYEQTRRLANTFPLSKAGQDLSFARLKSGAIFDNAIDMIQATETALRKTALEKGVSKNAIKNLFPDCGFN